MDLKGEQRLSLILLVIRIVQYVMHQLCIAGKSYSNIEGTSGNIRITSFINRH